MQVLKQDDPLLLSIVKAARQNLKGSEILLPTFFIGTPMGVQIIGYDWRSEADKDQAAATIRKVCAEFKAEFVALVSESWTLPPEYGREYMDDNGRRWKRVAEHPKAYEIVSFMVETKTVDLMGAARILPGRYMSEVEWREAPPGLVEGRFTGFLGPREVRS